MPTKIITRADLTDQMAHEGLIEVLVCAMAHYENGDAGLAEEVGKPPEFWDVELRPVYPINDSSDPFEEHCDLPSAEAAQAAVEKLLQEFPNINVEWL